MTGRIRAGLVGAVLVAVLAACGGGSAQPPSASPTSAGPSPTTTSTSVAPTTRPATTVAATSAAAPTTSTATATSKPATSRPATTKPATTVASTVPAGLAGTDVEVLPTTSTVVALTFDAGANAAGLASILATLRSTGTPASFFLTGDFVDAYPTQARSLAAAGYTIGNHTQDHPDLTTVSDASVRAQIANAQARIVAVTGVDPRPWFRFPFGARNTRVIADANDLGYAAVRWTVDSLGWKGTSGGQSVTSVRDRVLAAARPGAIVLMHVGSNPDDGTTLDADALPQIVSGLRAKGYTLISLDTFLG